MKLFLSPHNDDEVLFGAFTIQRERPLVIVVFDSYLQAQRGHGVTREDRRLETHEALTALGARALPKCLAVRDDICDGPVGPAVIDRLRAFARTEAKNLALQELMAGRLENQNVSVEQVFAPAIEQGGHVQHNAVGWAADLLWPGKVTHYLTYTRTGGKSRNEKEVPATGEMVRRKLRALACYESQIDIDALGCRPHFMRDLYEYYE